MSDKSIIIIGMDSNQSDKSTSRRCDVMKMFLEKFSLKSTHVDNQPTFHHNNLTSNSQIDHIYFYIPDGYNTNIVMDKILCKHNYPSNLSSHDVILSKIIIPKNIQNQPDVQEDFSLTYTEFNSMKPKWNILHYPEYEDQSYQAILNISKNKNNYSISELAQQFSEALVNTAQHIFGIINSNGKQNQKPCY